MTELRDQWDSEHSYYYAKRLYRKYGGQDLPQEAIDDIPKDLLFVDIWYDHFRGKPYPRYTFYVPWIFEDHPESMDLIIRACTLTKGLVAEVRPAKEEDFFMFRPETIDGDVLVITDVGCHTPGDLNFIFRGIECRNPDHGNRVYFHW